jgi:opacity protein-like surface antigen
MKKFVYAAALLVLLPAAVQAQGEPGNVRLGFFGGLSLPTSPEEFTDFYNPGMTFGGELRYQTASRTTLIGRVTYHRFAFDAEGARAFFDDSSFPITSFSADGGSARALAFTANVMQRLNRPEAKTSFFGSVGAGLYNVGIGDLKTDVTYEVPFGSSREITETEGESQTEFGLNFGAGIEAASGQAAAFLFEARYHLVFTDILEIDNAYFFSFLAGVNFRLSSQ